MYFLIVIVLQIVFGILGSIVTAWFSRQREFRADHGGATLAGRDDMLAALRRLAANRELVDTRHEALATMKISGTPTTGWCCSRRTRRSRSASPRSRRRSSTEPGARTAHGVRRGPLDSDTLGHEAR